LDLLEHYIHGGRPHAAEEYDDAKCEDEPQGMKGEAEEDGVVHGFFSWACGRQNGT
jgi:hypothetical protein